MSFEMSKDYCWGVSLSDSGNYLESSAKTLKISMTEDYYIFIGTTTNENSTFVLLHKR